MTTDQTTNSKQTISAIMVVHNEEDVIERALTSINNEVDEIVIVHDGDCSDGTLDICRKFTDNIFIRPYVGIMEAHLVFAINKTRGEWILRIDADEFLDSGGSTLRYLTENSDISAFRFVWQRYSIEKNKFLGKVQKKAIFFRKKDLYWFTMPHLAFMSRGQTTDINIRLGHIVSENKKKNDEKQARWTKLHAKFILQDFSGLESFQATEIDWKNHHNFTRKYRRLPILALLKFFKSLIETGRFANAKYSYLLGKEILELSKNKTKCVVRK